jgi:hypothetical protein
MHQCELNNYGEATLIAHKSDEILEQWRESSVAGGNEPGRIEVVVLPN